jgi:nitrogen fixation NifU-like protein
VNDTALSVDELRELYRELILDHARSPRHFGKLDDVTHSAEGINPLCGDKLRMYFHLDDVTGTIVDARFEGTGCAISVASASLLTDTVIGMQPDEAEAFFDAVTARLSGREPAPQAVDLGKLRALEGVREFPARVKCATLAWHAMHAALTNNEQPATTE